MDRPAPKETDGSNIPSSSHKYQSPVLPIFHRNWSKFVFLFFLGGGGGWVELDLLPSNIFTPNMKGVGHAAPKVLHFDNSAMPVHEYA